jgi:hypothetical protein
MRIVEDTRSSVSSPFRGQVMRRASRLIRLAFAGFDLRDSFSFVLAGAALRDWQALGGSRLRLERYLPGTLVSRLATALVSPTVWGYGAVVAPIVVVFLGVVSLVAVVTVGREFRWFMS